MSRAVRALKAPGMAIGPRDQASRSRRPEEREEFFEGTASFASPCEGRMNAAYAFGGPEAREKISRPVSCRANLPPLGFVSQQQCRVIESGLTPVDGVPIISI